MVSKEVVIIQESVCRMCREAQIDMGNEETEIHTNAPVPEWMKDTIDRLVPLSIAIMRITMSAKWN